jgi:hypothetical protein
MAMLTKTQLIKNINNGDFDGVLKELRRYGTISKDVQWECEEGFYKGSNRMFHVTHHKLVWNVEMLNGEVRRLGYTKYME